jgi:signal transduction histidine kinase
MQTEGFAGPRGAVRVLSGLLIEPLTKLGAIERLKARLLATLLLCVLCLGLTSAVVQAAVVPDFRSTFVAIAVALLVLSFAYAGSRTRLYRLSAALAATTPALACIAVGVRTPDDRVWYGFILIAVILASLFFSLRVAALVALAIFIVICLLPIWVVELRAPARLVPLLALHGVLSPLLLVAAAHQAAVERENRNQLDRMDARLMQIDGLEALARRAGSTAHDLNNLLTVIGANVSLLGAEPGLRLSRELSEIGTAVTRAAALSRQLLLTAREGSLRPQPLDAAEAVRNFESVLSRLVPASVRLVVHAQASRAHVEINPLQLERLLMNLVTNARDAMPQGGTITIECAEVVIEASGPEQTDLKPGRYLSIAVTDEGVGMDSASLARAFEPFFTTKSEAGGTGLGLTIVRDIALRAGGHVGVKSRPGEGTAFYVYLPARGRPPG